jgi:hypothetical protein
MLPCKGQFPVERTPGIKNIQLTRDALQYFIMRVIQVKDHGIDDSPLIVVPFHFI